MSIENLGNLIANNFLLPLTSGYMLVDTGYDHGFKHFLSEINQRKIDISEINYIFLTHAHDDHAGFLNELLSHNPILKVILHPKAVVALRRGQNSFNGACSSFLAYIFCKTMALFGKGQHKFPIIDIGFEQNYIFYGSEEAKRLEEQLSVQFFETPGHTDCSISLLFDDVLFCGDAAMNGLPSIKNITIWIENNSEFYDSWEKIISLKPKMIYPGHGKIFSYFDLQQHLPYVKQIKTYTL